MESLSYCSAVLTLKGNNPNIPYHNEEYGFPLISDDELFGRLILEINQAGLSWTTILKKKDNFKTAYNDFNIKRVAGYGQADIDRLLSNPGIIRNRLKIKAAIYNANQILELQNDFGSFKNWLSAQGKMDLREWVKLFKKHFKFTGGEITKEFLMSTGFLEGAHSPDCPVYHQILKFRPEWSKH
jgi:DNA-3-methyladenine glycosylase I